MLNPERIDFVRRRLGLTKIGLASSLEVDRKVLQRFETGKADLPAACVRRLCDLSGYPVEFFYKGTPVYPNPAGVSFRSLKSLTAASRDAAMAAGALAFEFDDWISAKYDLPIHSLVQVESSTPAAAALYLRAKWGIGERPIGNMINLLEAHGVRVFSLAEETRHLDAYSLWRDDKPYIFLNTLKTTERSRMDAAHELGHLVMHRHTGSSHINAEDEAQAFASAFMMPPNDLKAEFQWVRSLNELIEKKRRWGVSVAALNYAVHKIGRISDWNYRGNYMALAKAGRENEPNPMPPETSQVWTKILTDLWRQGITLSRVAKLLSVPEKELNDLLFGIASAVGGKSAPGALRVV
ncbi:XRE family transcriptional regulator [Roseomonas sp. CCTCC AB2023176]|uniref:XRE family transcriptional regulator n=1 Tax=Roseomonas sp. CCTCC AB2023176 TaxID=3342640 RepID=UPI0035D81484